MFTKEDAHNLEVIFNYAKAQVVVDDNQLTNILNFKKSFMDRLMEQINQNDAKKESVKSDEIEIAAS